MVKDQKPLIRTQDQKENNMFKITGSVKKIEVVTPKQAEEFNKEAEVKEEVKEAPKAKKGKKQAK